MIDRPLVQQRLKIPRKEAQEMIDRTTHILEFVRILDDSVHALLTSVVVEFTVCYHLGA